jgi:hypothetical protein
MVEASTIHLPPSIDMAVSSPVLYGPESIVVSLFNLQPLQLQPERMQHAATVIAIDVQYRRRPDSD